MSPVSLRKASTELKQHPRYVRGLVDGLGIKLVPIGNALAISKDDVRRLHEQIERRKSTEAAEAQQQPEPVPSR